MIYQFITDKDLNAGLKKYFRDQITIDADTAIALSEGAAFTIIKAKINNRYDLTKLFPTILAYNVATNYAVGAYAVGSDDNFYICTQAALNQDPTTANTFWSKSDPRDAMLVMCCIHIAIFFFVQSANNRSIPQDLNDKYVAHLEWLDDIKSGEENPDWPLLPDAASNVIAGSKCPEQQYRW